MPPKRMKTSYIWNYFSEVTNSNSLAVCNLCKQKLSYKSSSNNLKKHLQRKHPLIRLEESRSSENQNYQTGATDPSEIPSTSGASCIGVLSTIRDSVVSTKEQGETQSSVTIRNQSQTNLTSFLRKKISTSSRKKIDDNLMLLFVKDLQPFSIVEDFGFRKFTESLNPSYELPNRKTISNTMLDIKYNDAYVIARDTIKNIESMTLTTDCWTSRNTENFLAITGHYIKDDFKLNSLLLDCAPFDKSHTSKNLAFKLREIIVEWGIEDKILIIVSDNAENIRKAIKDELNMRHFGCYAHTVNLIARDSLTLITGVTDKVKTIIYHFRRSTVATSKLIEQQRVETRPKKLIQDVPTRWNSTFFMLERFTELEVPISTTLALLDKELPVVSVEEWQFMREVVNILKPLAILTEFISGQNYLTASSVIPLTDGLINIYENLKKESYTALSQELINSISSGIRTRLGDLENSNTLAISTFLDPRYKHFGFSNNQISERTQNIIISRITQLIRNKTTEVVPTPQEMSSNTSSTDYFWLSFEKRKTNFQPSGTAHSKAIIEVQRYLDEPPIQRNDDPLKWWKENAYNFPNLAALVKKNTMTVATSVPCESLFSKSGQIISERRNRLSASKVKKILFLDSFMEK